MRKPRGSIPLPSFLFLRSCNKEFTYDPYNKRGLFCGHKCFQLQRRKNYITKWYGGLVSGGSGYELSNFVRNHLLEENDYKCVRCGWGEVNESTNKVPLHVDHIDGNPFNHAPSSLRVLCPNCHSLTSTYGIKNKGNGRYSRGSKHPKHRSE